MRSLLPVTLVFAPLLMACKPTPADSPSPSHHADHAHHRFENAEAWSKQFEAPERNAWQKPDAVVASLALPPRVVVAAIGAGTGYFAMRFARAVPDGRVIAIDVEPD